MSISTDLDKSLTVSDLPRIHKKIAANILFGEESKALKWINLLRINNLEGTLVEEHNRLGSWPCSLLESAQARNMTRIVNILKEINYNR